MKLFRFVGAALGAIGGPIGTGLGYVFGKAIDECFESKSPEPKYVPHQEAYADQSPQDIQRNSFMIVLLTGITYVIRADGKVMHSEMECLRSFLRQTFGEDAVEEGESIVRRLIERQKQDPYTFRSQVLSSCQQVRQLLDPSQLDILLNFYVAVAKADKSVPQPEVDVLRELAVALGFTSAYVDQLLGLGGNTLDDAYKVLGVKPSATDAQVKKAYRKLVIENHPDRVATLGDDIRRAAEKKLQQINEAKEKVWAARSMS